MNKIVMICPDRNDVTEWVKYFEKENPNIKVEIYPEDTEREKTEFVATWNPPKDAFEKFPNLKVIASMAAGVKHITSKNVKENVVAQENELMGKRFLVKDSLENFEWKLEKESKMIGQYAAFKATAVRKNEDMWKRAGKRAKEWREKNAEETDLDSTAIAKQEKLLEDMQNITVWYTPQIPVKQGPDVYHGLPGLILEINFGNTTILCSKVVLNPKEKVEINMPDKGEVVSREEFAKITEEKTQEMMDRYGRGRGGRGRGGF